MKISGSMLIGSNETYGSQAPIHAVNPATGLPLDPAYAGGGEHEVGLACALAESAFDPYRNTSPKQRAEFLETIASEIEALGDALIERAMLETGLPRMRIEGERGRTIGQLRLFASVLTEGSWSGARIDPALPERQPLPRADLRLQHIALGPVAVFGASNFPLAFSVAGGDTASALAAGCPVVVKGHSAHPGTSELVGRAIQAAVKKCELPEGVFSLLFGSGRTLGTALVADPRILAVGFTGSRSGGTALMEVASRRPQPIPVYAEMSSLNPVFLLPEALNNRAEGIAQGFAGSLTMGAGQFCTNPGMVVAVDSPALDTFINATATALIDIPAQTMLTPGIHAAFGNGIEQLQQNGNVVEAGTSAASEGPNQCQAHLFTVAASDFLSDASLTHEVFGSSSLIIRCQSTAEFTAVAEHLEGQLTATLILDEADHAMVRTLLPVLERKAGRILCNGFPTGVEVCHAMVHGGPFPATSDGRSTSVGSAAIGRFLRPVCYQDLPESLLPDALKDSNPLAIPRLENGQMVVA